ncbi:hypothetical protein D3C76_1594530 [compost metagenome]
MLFAIYHVSPTPEMTASIFACAGVVLGVISVIAVVWVKFVMRKPLFTPEPLIQNESQDNGVPAVAPLTTVTGN